MDRGLRVSRYSRQTPVFGPDAQDALAAARVLVIGAGGLAAPVLPYLAGAGVGRIDIVDPDRVSLSNLHRQTLFDTGQVGTPKATAAAARIAALNPGIEVHGHCIGFDAETGPQLVARGTLVLDCADSFAASFTASDLCLTHGVALITASVLGMSGYACGVCGGAPSLRAVFPEPPETAASCATAGVSGPVVGMIGAIQAQMAIDQIIGRAPPPLGLMVRLDAQSWHMSRFRFDGAAEPGEPLRFVAPGTLTSRDLILDLRDTAEAPVAIHPAARRLEPGAAPPHPLSGQRTVLACATGLRAWRLGQELRKTWPGEIVLAAASPQPSET